MGNVVGLAQSRKAAEVSLSVPLCVRAFARGWSLHRRNFTSKSSTSPGLYTLGTVVSIGVMVAVSALAAPAVNRSFANQALGKAADRVRVSMGQARVRAIRVGGVHAVCYTPGRSWIDVAPLSQLSAIAGQASQRLRDQQLGVTSDYDDDLLPGRCVFVAGEIVNDARSSDAATDAQDAGSLQTILFYPDGTSQDASLTLQNELGQLIDVRLRGLTGTASIVRRQR